MCKTFVSDGKSQICQTNGCAHDSWAHAEVVAVEKGEKFPGQVATIFRLFHLVSLAQDVMCVLFANLLSSSDFSARDVSSSARDVIYVLFGRILYSLVSNSRDVSYGLSF